MGKKMIMKKLNHFQWASSCSGNAKTLSFRAAAAGDDIFKTVNSVFFEAETTEVEHCHSSPAEEVDAEVETVVKGVRESPPERLFFEPGRRSWSASIMEEEEAEWVKESVAVAVETEDPYGDFRRSMEEMVESHGVKEWEGLEELLGWYLRVNGKSNHGFIVGAFVDLLLAMAGHCHDHDHDQHSEICSSSHDSTACYSSALSSFSSSPLGSSTDQIR